MLPDRREDGVSELPPRQGTTEIDAYITQARWLLEWHNKRKTGSLRGQSRFLVLSALSLRWSASGLEALLPDIHRAVAAG